MDASDASGSVRRVVASAPGKVILFGEHAVVHGKTALAASLSNLRTYAELTIGDGEAALALADFPSCPTVAFTLAELVPLRALFQNATLTDADEQAAGLTGVDDDSALRAIKEICVRKGSDESTHQFSALVVFLYLYLSLVTTCDDREKAEKGVHVRVWSTVPMGAGLGSSAAFSVACAAALLQHFHGAWESDGVPKANAATARTNINRWALKAEKITHGTPSGIDNSIATFGGALAFYRKQVEGRVEGVMDHLDDFPSLKLIITNTAVPRKTSILVAGVRALLERYPVVMDPLLESIHAITMEAIRFLTTEVNEVQLHSHLASLIDINHNLLNAVGVGHPQLDKIRLLSSQYQLHSKLTGAGGGGCAFTLVAHDTSDDHVKQLIADLDKEFGANSSLLTGVGGPGVTFHNASNEPLS